MSYILPQNATILIGSDHAGFEYKETLKKHLEGLGFSVNDLGTYTTASCDYPDYAHALASKIENGQYPFGILICGSGIGVSMVANKHKNVFAALCWNIDSAMLARQHNNANVICLPARFVDIELAKNMIDIFLSTSFEGGRHANRVQKINLSKEG